MSTKRTRSREGLGQRTRRTLSLAAIAAGLNVVLSYAVSLYTDQFRAGFEGGVQALFAQSWETVPLSVLIALACVVVFNKVLPRTHFRHKILPAELPVKIDAAVQRRVGRGDSVAGRQIRMLESEQGSDDLIVFLPGLGLDAEDFRTLMDLMPHVHCIAVTMYGFGTDEADDPDYTPISLETHLHLLLELVLGRIRAKHPKKRLTVVGFSAGADYMLLVPERETDRVQSLRIYHTVLLDPNVNNTTTVLSARLGRMDPGRGPAHLNSLSDGAGDDDFQFLATYVARICRKNLAHLTRHAAEVAAEWDTPNTETFFKRLRLLESSVGKVTCVFSNSYRHLCGELAKGEAEAAPHFPSRGHFELLSPEVLRPFIDPQHRHRD
ncbi:alpha/beta fold hydrolase [Glycomyces sp. NPDC047369]